MVSLLIEIGTEEIPASYLSPALEEIGESLRAGLAGERLEPGECVHLGTARRLTFFFAEVLDRAPSVVEERRGPAAKIAFDEAGAPTKAAVGFARSAGVDPSELTVVETEKGSYVSATVAREGRPASDLLGPILERALRKVSFPKTMRWTGSDLQFARPIRRIVALLDEQVVPLVVAGVTAGRETAGHHFLGAASIPLASADLDAYVAALREQHVIVDPAERREAVRAALTERLGDLAASSLHEGLLEEVVWLSEWPTVVEGRIDPQFLALPVEVLETAMRVHLRFFPVLDEGRKAEARFLAVMDRDEEQASLVAEGLERVLAGRLADACFFLEEDGRRTLEERFPELHDKAVHRDLGSYAEKAERLVRLSRWVAEQMGLDEAAQELAGRAARLAKVDLVTEMVGEFPELQGTVGRIYALAEGEDPAVAGAIEDHYRPRGPRDDLPRGPVAAAVAIAEKLDSLVGFFHATGAPSGSSDPFGLRRQTLGLIRICLEQSIDLHIPDAIGQAGREFEIEPEGVGAFIFDRLQQSLIEGGYRYDLVGAAMASDWAGLPGLKKRLDALADLAGEDCWTALVEVVGRTGRILKDRSDLSGDIDIDAKLLEEGPERALHGALIEVAPEYERQFAGEDFAGAARTYVAALAAPVHEFFEKVFVNADDPAIRANRRRLLYAVNRLFTGRFASLEQVVE